MFIDGVFYTLINVLFVLMGITGPTPVAGTNGDTGAFLGRSNHAVQGQFVSGTTRRP
jgi:hypothetical protein